MCYRLQASFLVKQKRFPKDPYFSNKIPGMLEAFAWYLLEHRKSNDKKYHVEPEKVKMATSKYKKQNDIYQQFIDETIVKDKEKSISIVELYSQFKEWFKESIPNQSVPIKNDIKEHFMKTWGDEFGGRKWKGYRFRSIIDDDVDDDEE